MESPRSNMDISLKPCDEKRMDVQSSPKSKEVLSVVDDLGQSFEDETINICVGPIIPDRVPPGDRNSPSSQQEKAETLFISPAPHSEHLKSFVSPDQESESGKMTRHSEIPSSWDVSGNTKSPQVHVRRIRWLDVNKQKSLSRDTDEDSMEKQSPPSVHSYKSVIYFALFFCLVSVCGNVALMVTTSGHKCLTSGHKLFLQVQSAGDVAITATTVVILLWVGWETLCRK